MTTSSARARAWACTGGSGADDFVYDEAAERDDEDDKAASGASSAHGSSDSEEESGGEGEAHHVRQRLRHCRLVGTLWSSKYQGLPADASHIWSSRQHVEPGSVTSRHQCSMPADNETN